MDPRTCHSCRRCKGKKKAHEKPETARRTSYVVKTCRQCCHRSSCDACTRNDGRMPCKHGSCQRRCSDSSDTNNCKEERSSGKKNSRSESPYSRSSSLESGYGSDGSFCMNSNLMFRCPHSIVGKTEEQIRKKNLARTSHRYVHTSSTRVHQHRYSHHCPRIRRSSHGLHCCHNKKRHNDNYSGDSDDSRKRNNEFSFCRHRHRSHVSGPVSSHEICHSKKPEDTKHCSSSSMGVKEELISKTRDFTDGVCITSEDHNVEGSNVCCVEHIQMPFGCEKGSLIINREQNGAMTRCATGNEKTEKQEHHDEWLQLSLKTYPRPNLTVEGISKSDFKLSLPEVEEQLNVRDYFHSGPSEIKKVNINSIQSSTVDFPASSPRLDPFMYHQPRENLDYITVLPDLNLPPNIANVCHGISIPAKFAKSRLDLHCNCHNSHVQEEPRCTLLNQRRNWANLDHEEKCRVSEHALLPKWLKENSINHTRIRAIGNEALMGVHIGDMIIILDDSEGERSKQNTSCSLPGQHNVVGTCEKTSVPEEISDNHATQILVHGRNLQAPLSAGNVTEDREEINIELRWPFLAQSTENLGKYSDSVVRLHSNKCSILEISSSENVSINNEMADDTPPNNSSLQEDGGYIPQADLAVPRFDNDTMAGYGNYKVDNYFDKGGSIGGFKSKENDFPCKSWSNNDNKNIPAVGRDNSGTLEHNLIEPQCIEANSVRIAKSEYQMWNRGISCDLCGQGPSLMYGEWYAWCCGSRLSHCICTEEHKRKLLLSMKCKKTKDLKKLNGHKWSGKVHRMCALWSSEVFEKGDARDQLEGLIDVVRRGRSLFCAECKRFGATLGCRVDKCRRSFHYPCADRLSSQLRCRMWEGFKLPVACYNHSHVDDYCTTAKDRMPHINIKCRKNPVTANGNQHATSSSKKPKFEDIISNETVIGTGDLNTNNQEKKPPSGIQDDHAMIPCLFNSVMKRKGIDPTIRNGIAADLKLVERRSENARRTSCRKDDNDNDNDVKCLGQNLICKDISNGTEAIKIPCTNDIDHDSVPHFEYISENRFSAPATAILESVLSNKEKLAKVCNGCDSFDIDDPEASISTHVNLNGCTRDQDARIDWQGEPMVGRLPYDRAGRLQHGSCSADVVDCNTKCPCGANCLNRELQNGLKFALEVFKTKEGWSVRALEQIPRGRFVIEYVGEVLSQNEALKSAEMCEEYSFRYLFNMDHPSVLQEDQLVIDIFRMSNLARFFNHSCAGNLSIYRVYTETSDTRIYRLGMYACRDIQLGEELTYDYNV